MTAVMEGVRILEVAEHTFVPAASAILADWGAEVIKIEHVERGDAMRGLASSGIAAIGGGDVHVLLEHSNRGKKSLGLDLTTDEGLDILYRLAGTCDVFLTNKVPRVRSKLNIELDQIRGANPDIIYVGGTGQGERGPEADRGSYDSLAYWARAGIAMGLKSAEDDFVSQPPGPAFGDSIGAMTIAGGIMGALFHRERTGEATTVDVSLLGVGLWSMGAGIALSLQLDTPWQAPPRGSIGNPLTAIYETRDNKFISFTCLQAVQYWPEIAVIIGRPELADDDRYAHPLGMMENAHGAWELLTEVFLTRTGAEWREALSDFSGQWTMVQDTIEAAKDPQAVANGYVGECKTAAGTPFELVTAPVQYGGAPAAPKRAPDFNEHGDEILEGIGLDMEAIIDLKVKGVVA